MTDPKRELEQLQMGQVPDSWKKPEPLVQPEAERGTLPDEVATHIVSMTFASRSDNTTPHIVTQGYDGIPRCTCRATHTCWAVKAYCLVKGVPTP